VRCPSDRDIHLNKNIAPPSGGAASFCEGYAWKAGALMISSLTPNAPKTNHWSKPVVSKKKISHAQMLAVLIGAGPGALQLPIDTASTRLPDASFKRLDYRAGPLPT
jgi:hypothetical protein